MSRKPSKREIEKAEKAGAYFAREVYCAYDNARQKGRSGSLDADRIPYHRYKRPELIAAWKQGQAEQNAALYEPGERRYPKD